MPKFFPIVSLDSAMYQVVLLLAFVTPLSTAAASIAIALGVVFIVGWSLKNKTFPQFDADILEVLAVYLVCQIFIALMSWEPLTSLREVFGEACRFLPLIFAMTFVKQRKQLCGIMLATLAAILINDAAGLIQYFILDEPRAFGFAHTPTFYGSFMLIQLPILIFMAQLEIMAPQWRMLAAGAAGLTLICLVLSMTRGAWLALIGVVLIFVALKKNYRHVVKKVFAGLAIIFLLATLISPRLQDRLATFADMKFQSNTERVLMWKSALDIFGDYPLYGVGQKMFVRAYNEQYISSEAKEIGHTQPHSNLLNAASEGGLIGLASFVGLYAYFFWKFFNQHMREKFLVFGAGVTAFLILAGLQLEGLTDTNMIQVPIMREFWLLAGTLLAAENILQKN